VFKGSVLAVSVIRKISEDSGRFRVVWEDFVEICEDFGRFGRILEGLVRFGEVCEGLGRFGRICGDA
jgi:hypothetical protein